MTWKQVLDAISQIVTLTQQTQKNKDSIKDLQEQINEMRAEMRDMRREMKDMTAGFQRMVYEVTRAYENDAHEREKMALRLEVQMLRFQQKLPPAPSDANTEL